jgi:hypothetical protein
MMAHCVTGELMKQRGETVTGITVSPKGQFSIIKIWNTTTAVSDKALINQNMKGFKIGDDVTYTAHKSRPK